MKILSISLLVLTLLFGCASTQNSPEPSVGIGDYAPDFKVVGVSENELRLSDFTGKKNVVLIFYESYL